MEAALNRLIFEKAKKEDIKELIDLLYITEPDPEEEWGYGSEHEMKNTLRKLLKTKDNRFSLENIVVIRENKKLAGMALLIEGKNIDKLTANSEKKVISIQKGFMNKIFFICSNIKGKFLYECEEDEFYISNIAIKKAYRGKGYAKILIEKAFEIARKNGYKKASLMANNDKLVEFYKNIGFILIDSKKRRMMTNI